MPKSTESINKDLDELLASHGFDVTPMDSSGKEVPVPDEADLFQFHFHRNGNDYGTVTVTVDGLQRMIVYYDDKIASSGTSDNEEISWIDTVKQLKKFALTHQLAFELKDTDRLRTDMKRREHTKKLEESWLGIGFSVRSDKLWPAKLFENKNIEQSAEFDEIINDFRTGATKPKQGAKCILVMVVRSADEISIIYGIAVYVGDNSTHYVLKNSTGTHEYSKKNQLVFANKNEFDKLETFLKFKYSDINIEVEQMKVMETSMSNKPEESVQLAEGYYGNKKMSYNDDLPAVKMVIKHNKQLEETDQRFRYIERIFLETSEGERFQAPTNKPSRARMFARHIAEGGAYRDDRWSHLQEICEDLDALGGFVRATHNKHQQFNESAQRMISEAVEKYTQLRETAKRLSTSRGYNKYFESYAPSIITETDEALAEVFKHSSIDSRIECALPVLSKFGIKHTEISESSMFEAWAEGFLDEALNPMTDTQEQQLIALLNDNDFRVGPNAEVAIAELNDIIDSDDLNTELRKAAEQDSNNDAAAVVKSWMERQHNQRYDDILNKVDAGEDEAKDSENTEPAEVKPQPEKTAQPPAPPAGDMGAGSLPPLPPLPPLAEDSDFKRMLKLSGF